ncbi:MAG: hypothetical protein AAFV95_03560 [Bacteroidota bacterium]
MALSNRHRYKSRREKRQQINRNTRIILLFAGIAALVWAFMNRGGIYDWFIKYFI